jgi:hypothetical protein
MKLEYLPDASLIRLYSFTSDEVAQLHSHVLKLSEGTVSSVALDSLLFVEAIDGCRLSLERQEWDQGILRLDSESKFVYRLTRGGWEDVANLVKPFINDATGFQQIALGPSETELVLSNSGKW